MANTAYSALPCWQYARVCLTIFVNLYLDNLTLRNRQRRHMRNRCKQARDNDVRKLKQDIFNLVFVKRHACSASFYERTL
jgi:hypothetical protein